MPAYETQDYAAGGASPSWDITDAKGRKFCSVDCRIARATKDGDDRSEVAGFLLAMQTLLETLSAIWRSLEAAEMAFLSQKESNINPATGGSRWARYLRCKMIFATSSAANSPPGPGC